MSLTGTGPPRLKWISDLLMKIHAQVEASRDPNGHNRKTWIVLATSLISLILFQYLFMSHDVHWQGSQTLLEGWQQDAAMSHATRQELIGLSEVLIWAMGTIFVYLILPGFVVRLVLKEKLADYGFRVGEMRPYFKIYAAIFFPVALIVGAFSFVPGLRDTYPYFIPTNSWELLLLWELVYAFQFLALEFFYRGFMLHGLKNAFGMGSLWIMLFPYVMVHFAKPWPEAIGAIFAGLGLGLLSLRSKSILGGAMLHILIAWWADLLGLWHRGHLP